MPRRPPPLRNTVSTRISPLTSEEINTSDLYKHAIQLGLKTGKRPSSPDADGDFRFPNGWRGRRVRESRERAGTFLTTSASPSVKHYGLVRQYFRFSPAFRYTVGGQFDTGQRRYGHRQKARATRVATIGWTDAAWQELWARSDARSFHGSLAYRVGVPDRRRLRYGYGADIPFR